MKKYRIISILLIFIILVSNVSVFADIEGYSLDEAKELGEIRGKDDGKVDGKSDAKRL